MIKTFTSTDLAAGDSARFSLPLDAGVRVTRIGVCSSTAAKWILQPYGITYMTTGGGYPTRPRQQPSWVWEPKDPRDGEIGTVSIEVTNLDNSQPVNFYAWIESTREKRRSE